MNKKTLYLELYTLYLLSLLHHSLIPRLQALSYEFILIKHTLLDDIVIRYLPIQYLTT